MQLNSISVTTKAVTMKTEANKETDDINDLIAQTVVAKEEPLPSFKKAWEKLPEAFCAIMELPKDYATGLTVTKLSVSRTKLGTRSVVLSATKQLEVRSEFLHTISAPSVQVDKAADGESGAVQVEKKVADLITKAIHEAERYMGGERSQTLLNFDEAKAALQATADQGKDLLAGVN